MRLLLRNSFRFENLPFKIFTLTRIFGLAIKPIFLYGLLALELNAFSISYIFTITFIQYCLILYNTESHQRYYKYELDLDVLKFRKIKEYIIYCKVLSSHIYFLLIPAFLLLWFSSEDILLSLLVVLLSVIDKVYDELLRYLIYGRKYVEWSKLFLSKSLIPLLIVASCYLSFKWLSIYFYLFVAIFVNLYVLSRAFDFEKRLFKFSYFVYCKYGPVRSPFLLLFSIISSQVLVVDKLLIGFLYNDLLPSYALVCNIAVLTILFNDYLFLTVKKPQMINFSGDFLAELRDLRLYRASVFLPIALSCLAYILPTSIYQYFYIDKTVLIFIILTYGIYNLTAFLALYSYWNVGLKPISIFEATALLLFILFVNSDVEFSEFLFGYLSYNILRMSLYLLFINLHRYRLGLINEV